MNMKLVAVAVAAFGLATSPLLMAQGCCGGGAMKEGCGMSATSAESGLAGHPATAAVAETQPVKPVFAQPVQSVFDNYLKVQSALVQDSLEGISRHAAAMTKAIQADPRHTLHTKVAEQAETLAKAKDLATARDAFKALSDSLIVFVKGQKSAAGTYFVAYCPMAKASWIQTGTTVMNPYMGSSMPHCGQLRG